MNFIKYADFCLDMNKKLIIFASKLFFQHNKNKQHY